MAVAKAVYAANR